MMSFASHCRLFPGVLAALLALLPLQTSRALGLDEIQVLPLSTSDMVYSIHDGFLYASMAGTNAVVAVRPDTGQTVQTISVGNKPGKVAISEDGGILYVVTEAGSQIDRVDVASATRISILSLGNTPIRTTDLAVVPGRPDSIAVACNGEVRIYDGLVQRPQAAAGSTVIEFGSSSVLYGYNNEASDYTFYTMAVGSEGVTNVTGNQNVLFGANVDFVQAGGLLYSTSGSVVDPITQVPSSPFAGVGGRVYSAIVAADPIARRVCYLGAGGVSAFKDWIKIFDLDSFLPVGNIHVPGTWEEVGSLIRWGTDGLAYRVSTNQVVLLRSSLLPSAPAADLSVRQEFVPADLSNSTPAVLRIFVENHGPNPAQDVVLNVGIQGAVRIDTIAASAGTWQTTTNGVVGHFGSQPASTTNVLTIQLAGGVLGLTRWGVDGLALYTSAGEVAILRSSLVPVPPGQDTDGDSMPDAWESRYGLNPYSRDDASMDPDGDGQTNLAEFLAGTDPTDQGSALRLLTATRNGTNLLVTFPSASGKHYQLEVTDALPTSSWTSWSGDVTGTGGLITNRVAIGLESRLMLLRVKLVQ